MSKKIIFFDIDGTLLHPRLGVSSPTIKTKETIQTMISLGHIPVVATGRPLCMIKQDVRDLGFTSYISSAGAHVTYEGNTIMSDAISSTLANELFQYAVENQIYVFSENSERIYIHPDQYDHWDTFFLKRDAIAADKMICTTDISNVQNYKLFVRWYDETAYQKLVQKYSNTFTFGAFTCPDGTRGSDVIYHTHSKAQGILTMLKYLDIPISDTYAVGDGTNDIEMFDVVANSVAMGNAEEFLKKIATYVTSSVVEDGIYEFFHTLDWMK